MNGEKNKLHFENYFLIHKWCPSDQSCVFYKFEELRKIHVTFGHHTENETRNLLKIAKGNSIETIMRISIINIIVDCKTCTERSDAPRQFKLTIRTADRSFNLEVQVDTTLIYDNPVVNMKYLAKNHTDTRFVRNEISQEIWKYIRRMWTFTFFRLQYHLGVDQGRNYVSAEFTKAARDDWTKFRELPIEIPGSKGTVERYKTSLCHLYQILSQTLEKTWSNDDCLIMAKFGVNSVVGPEVLWPMAYGTLPRPTRKQTA